MELKFLERKLELKEVNEDGAFEGLASVYGNVDLGGDVVEPGAFKQYELTKDGMIRILDSHSTRTPIGKGKLTDTHLGLAVKGQLLLQLPAARVVHTLMKEGIVDGLSIGFDTNAGGDHVDDKGVRHLTDLKLWEVSTTIFPMNPVARISSVKALDVPPTFGTLREAEEWARDALKLSRDGAKEFVARFKRALLTVREEPPTRDATDEEAAAQVKEMKVFLSGIV